MVPDADQVTARVTAEPEFFDAGVNFESVSCHRCGQSIHIADWTKAMDDAYHRQFADLTFAAPCCGESVSLNDLRYDWPQGFACFALEARNAGMPDIDIDGLGHIIGHPMRTIRAHY